MHDFCLAFVVIDPDRVKKWCEQNGVEFNDDIVKNEKLIQEVYDSMIALANAQKLNSLEKPKQLTLLKDPFTDQNGYLTPTMKLKRNVAKEMLKDQITEMYGKAPMKPTTGK